MSSRATSLFRPRLVPRLVLAAAVLVGSAGCAADPADSGAAAGTGNTVAAEATTTGPATDPGASVAPGSTDASDVSTAPGRTVPLVGGGTLDISTLADKPLALWFWAPG